MGEQMRGNARLRLRQAAALGVLAGAVVMVPVVSAGALTPPPVVEIEPGGSFTLSGGDCLWDEDDVEEAHPGVVIVGLVNVEDAELKEPPITFVPNRGEADEEGDWSVTNTIPGSLEDGDYIAAPVCADPDDLERDSIPMVASAKILRLATPAPPGETTTTTDPEPPPTIPPGFGEGIDPPPAPPKPVPVKPKYTG
jgi:hypothetical protein